MTKSLIQEFNERVDIKKRQLTSARRWLNTPDMRKIMSSVEYLAERAGTRAEAYLDTGYNAIYITLRDLSGLKDEKLEVILNSIIHLEADKTKSEDLPSCFTREFRFTWNSKDPEYYGSLSVIISASFKEDSETCKRVVVGYKEPAKEATPIYELRCDEAAQ